jgi:NDP-sugar pyrophosphorylase family protein
MCGGRGMRLHPLTEDRPKPLFNVGGKPILQQIIEGFSKQGFTDITLCVNYRADLIREYFGGGEKFDCNIRYIREEKPLGTAGALSLLCDSVDTPLIVSNADVLTKLDYHKLIDKHITENAQLTVCLALHQHQIPFGVARFDENDNFIGLDEKPIENFPVNSGIYCVDPSVLSMIQYGCYADMPDLIEKCTKVSCYALENAWYDVGNFIDLARANNDWS